MMTSQQKMKPMLAVLPEDFCREVYTTARQADKFQIDCLQLNCIAVTAIAEGKKLVTFYHYTEHRDFSQSGSLYSRFAFVTGAWLVTVDGKLCYNYGEIRKADNAVDDRQYFLVASVDEPTEIEYVDDITSNITLLAPIAKAEIMWRKEDQQDSEEE